MFFIFSKTIAFLAKPIGVLFLLALFTIFFKNHTKRKRIGLVFLVMLYIFSCPAIINPLVRAFEIPTRAISEVKSYNYGIVLTGGLINESKSLGDNLFLGPQGDRLWQAVELYKAQKIRKIIITGGDGFGRAKPNQPTENHKARDFLIKSGVHAENIIQEQKAVNTYENAKFTSKILGKHTDSVLIITSGFHLRRALACFEKQNVPVEGFACSPISDNYAFKWQDLFPSMDAFRSSDIIANELIGLAMYKLLGYI